MSDNKKHTPDPEQIDRLLKDTFLDLNFDAPENEGMLEALATSVMTPDSFQNSNSSGSFSRFFKKFYLQLIALFCVIATLFFLTGLYMKRDVNKETKLPVAKKVNPTPPVLTDIKEDEKEIHPPEESVQLNSITPILSKPFRGIPASDRGMVMNMTSVIQKIDSSDFAKPFFESSFLPDEIENKEISYGLPQFTLEDVKANNKQKKKMIDQLIKPSKPNYLLIPNGKLNYNGNTKKIGDFFMQGHEVTNLEYRTFLFELLYQKRKDDYLKARPNEDLWINCTGTGKFDSFKKDYFLNKAYNDYPVVNITAEAAKMYCVWLDSIAQVWADDDVDLYIDLPKESEWIYCAKGGYSNSSYPWGTNNIQNKKNVFLANFGVQKDSAKLNRPFYYTVRINPRAFTSAGLVLNADTLATAGVLEYNPNPYGLYCMSGNVAEWVLSEDGQSTKAVGGSWGSDFEHLKINSEEEFKEVTCSPFIGFRILVLMRKK